MPKHVDQQKGVIPGDRALPGAARVVDSKDRDGTPVRSLYVDTRHIEACSALWNAGDFNQLGFSSYRDAFEAPDIGWVHLFAGVRRLHVCLDRVVDLTPLAEHCPGLEVFFANDDLNALQDCASFPRLRSLGQRWTRHLAFPARMPHLTSLALQAFRPEGGDLTQLPNAPELQSLALFRPGIRSLDGLARYTELAELAVAYAPQLSSAAGLRMLQLARSISFDHCQRLQGLDAELRGLSLEKLQLTQCGPLGAIRFVQEMPDLKSLVFTGTNVMDGDLSILLHHPALRHVAFTRKSHFSHGERDILQALPARGSAAPLKVEFSR